LVGFVGSTLANGFATGLIGRGAEIPVEGRLSLVRASAGFPLANDSVLGVPDGPIEPATSEAFDVGETFSGKAFGGDDGEGGGELLANGLVTADLSGNAGVV
jgi:hypothetical protein